MSRKPKTEKKKNQASAPRKGRKLSCGKLILIGLLCIIAGFVVAAAISMLQNGTITSAEYEVETEKIRGEVRIALISDLHRMKFDETNQQLVDITAAQDPDLIAVDGDMLERDFSDAELEALASLFERLMRIAPVYFTPGNHDYRVYFNKVSRIGGNFISGAGKSDALLRLEQTGAVFLENDYLDIEVNGQKLRIGGFYGHAVRMDYDSDSSWETRRSFLAEFCDTDSYKLMLSHRPDSFIRCDETDDWNIDLILCGHTHNGMISLPFGLGAIWTSEGIFPEHDRGEFMIGSHSTMIISAGLAGGKFIPRVFNPPEIAVITIRGK